MAPVRLMVIGAGNRGTVYSRFAIDEPSRAGVVAVVDPNPTRLRILSDRHDLRHTARYAEIPERDDDIWASTDAAIVATPDSTHCQIALQLLERGQKHVLVEKPMATSEEDCRAVAGAAEEHGARVSVCHVLRYTPMNLEVKRLIASGELGAVLSIRHTEPVGHYHFAHSFVRGQWRRADESSCSLLTKSCHDIDLISFWMEDETGGNVRSVSSFGSLRYFRKGSKPTAAGDATRCLDCAHENQCPYSAKKIYLDAARRGARGWPVNVLVDGEVTPENVESALRSGQYGRCVYECDNDVCDNQIVNFRFENGSTASFNMIATTERICTRQTKVYGSDAELTADASRDEIRVFDFLANEERVMHPKADNDGPGRTTSSLSGHGFADYHLMDSFVRSVAENDPSLISTNARESLKTHLLAFRAEQSRLSNSTLSW